jgi:hypothetical protein
MFVGDSLSPFIFSTIFRTYHLYQKRFGQFLWFLHTYTAVAYSTHVLVKSILGRRIVQVNTAVIFKQELYFTQRVLIAWALFKLVFVFWRAAQSMVSGSSTFLPPSYTSIPFIVEVIAVLRGFYHDLFSSNTFRDVPNRVYLYGIDLAVQLWCFAREGPVYLIAFIIFGKVVWFPYCGPHQHKPSCLMQICPLPSHPACNRVCLQLHICRHWVCSSSVSALN